MSKVSLTKEEFVKYLNKIQHDIKRRKDFNDAIDKICDGYPVIELGNEWLDTSLELLSKAMNDKPDKHGTLIEWWLYEAKEGDKYLYFSNTAENQSITGHKGGQTIKVSINTPEELYDYLANREKCDE